MKNTIDFQFWTDTKALLLQVKSLIISSVFYIEILKKNYTFQVVAILWMALGQLLSHMITIAN